MNLADKLQLKSGTSVAVLGLPAGVDLELTSDLYTRTDAAGADAVVVFATNCGVLDSTAGPAWAAARDDRLAWIAYPKAGQLGTDLSRDVLVRHALERDAQPVRQVAIDSTWSAMRFRPAS